MFEITSGPICTAKKVVVYGVEGIGKTCFAATMPNALFIDLEGSTADYEVRRLPAPTSWPMLLDEVRYIIANPGLCGTLVIDTMDWAERLATDHVVSSKGWKSVEDGAYGTGRRYVYEEMGKLLDLLTDVVKAGVNVCINAHATIRKFEQPNETGAYDRWEMKLQDSPKCSVKAIVKEWADLLIFANYEVFVTKTKDNKSKAAGGQRVMYTTHHPCWDAKNRFDLPEKLPFDLREIAHLFKWPPIPDSAYEHSDPAPAPQAAQVSEAPDPAPAVSAPVTPTSAPAESYPFDVDIPAGTDPQLADLMRANFVTSEEISAVVAARGYFPAGMAVNEYPADFVKGVLVGAWDTVFEFVKGNRK